MEKKESSDRKEAEAWMVSKAPVDPKDPRENEDSKAPQDPLSTPPIHPWQKVPEVTQDSQALMGSQEAEASQETLAPLDSQGRLLEMKIQREAFRGRWDPKASQENLAAQHTIQVQQELMENQVSKESLDLQAHLDQMASCLA